MKKNYALLQTEYPKQQLKKVISIFQHDPERGKKSRGLRIEEGT